MVKLNTLSSKGTSQNRKRVGRGIGSGQGKTAGRGHKGQKSRSGGSIARGFEGGQMPLQRRLPKVGFKSVIGRSTAAVRLSELAKVEGDVVDMEALWNANVLPRSMTRAKIMLSGEVTRAVTVKGIRVTKGAKAAIEAAGGKVED